MNPKKFAAAALIGGVLYFNQCANAGTQNPVHKRRPASAATCPDGADLDKTVAMVKAAKTCYEADNTAGQCAWGSSADVQIAGAATEVCLNGVAKKMSAADHKTYEGLGALCDKKYGKMQGTLYISMNAFCREEVAKLFNELFTPPDVE